MESVITDFLRKHDTVPRNELITFIKQMFELSSKTFFEKEEIQKEKKTKTKTTPKKKRTSSSSRQINGEEEKVSRRHLAEEKIASMSCDDLFLETNSYSFESQNYTTLCKIAQKVALQGYTKMKKDDLVLALEKYRVMYNQNSTSVKKQENEVKRLPFDEETFDKNEEPLKKKPRKSVSTSI